MYAVSDKYKSKMFNSVRKRKFTIDITTTTGIKYKLGEDNIAENSINISNACVSGSYFELGSVYVGELDFTIIEGMELVDDILDAEVIYKILIDVGDTEEPEYEEIPMGVFTVYETSISGKNVIVTCYDNMKLLDKQIKDPVASNVKIFGLLKKIATECDVELGMSESEVNSFPSTSIIIVIGAAPGKSYRDYLMYCAEAMGGFATFDRYGKLVIRKFSNTPVLTIPKNSISKIETDYYEYSIKRIECFNTYADDVINYDNGNKTGFKYIIDNNNGIVSSWWDRYKLERQQCVREIGEFLKNLKYRSIAASIWSEPSLDLGDMISFESDNYVYNGIIMKFSMGVYGTEVINSFGVKKDDYVGVSQLKRNLSSVKSSSGSIKLSISYVDGSDLVVG